MKKNIFLLILLLCVISSCEEKEEVITDVKMATRSISPVTSLYFDWEDVRNVFLLGYDNVTLPWYSGAASPTIMDVAQDYKKYQGWEMLYNFCTDPNTYERGKYYLIFYNKFTGIMRVFYYSIYDPTNSNSSFCNLSFDNSNKLLSNAEKQSLANNQSIIQNLYVTPLVNDKIKALKRGWNCYEYRLSYDPDIEKQNAHFNISYYDAALSKITLSSDVNLRSEGTIVNLVTSNPFKPFISKMGKTAASALDSLLQKGGFFNKKTTFSDLLKSGAESIVKKGVNVGLGNILAVFNKTTPTKYTLNFTTQGVISTEGTITSEYSSNAVEISRLLLPGCLSQGSDILPIYNKPLGVWSLASTPIIEIEKGVSYGLISKKGKIGTYDCGIDFALESGSVKVLLNPALNSELDSCKTQIDLISEDVLVPYLFYNSSVTDYGGLTIKPYYGGVHFNFVTSEESDLYNFYDDKINSRIENLKVAVTVTLYPKSQYEESPIIETRIFTPIIHYVNKISEPRGILRENYSEVYTIRN